MKTRYQDDYLREHRAHLLLANQLEDIRAGRGGDGCVVLLLPCRVCRRSAAHRPEVAVALRIRLNETVESVDKLQSNVAVLETRATAAETGLARAESDCASCYPSPERM